MRRASYGAPGGATNRGGRSNRPEPVVDGHVTRVGTGQTVHMPVAPAPAVTPAVSPAVDDRPTTDETIDPDRPWVVLVWNDPINLMSYVTFVLQKLFGYSLEKATELMLDVHHKGRAAVSNGSREKAELDVFRLHEHGLWATMQQDD